MRKFIATYLIITLFCGVTFAQELLKAELAGIFVFHILDEVDLEPVATATISIRQQNGEWKQVAISDHRGRVYLKPELVKKGAEYRIEILGYEVVEIGLAQLNGEPVMIYLSHKPVVMDPAVISAIRDESDPKDLPNRIEVIDRKLIAFRNPQTAASMLRQSGSVFVQQSQMGGGSPNLRGFEANKVLLVVDGIRMNNAIYRGGHLQNVITLDPNMLERSEVLFGPSSVMYGSDALGGVMAFYSKTPQFGSNGEPELEVNAMSRFSSANDERTGHLNFNIGFDKVALLTSLTGSTFGDLRSGNLRHKDYADFGRREFYSSRVGDMDTMIANDDPNLQIGSGYTQYDFMQKVYWLPSPKHSHQLNFQYSTSSDVPRYDRLTQFIGDTLQYADWHYGPQNRMLISYMLNLFTANKIFDSGRLILAYQGIEESRITRRFGEEYSKDRYEDVSVYSANLDFSKAAGEKHKLNYGLEYAFNDVQSNANQTSVLDGSQLALDTRYPDGGSTMSQASAYLLHRWRISPKLILTEGVRFTAISLSAEFIDKSFYSFLPDEISQNNAAASGSIGIVYRPDSLTRLALQGATGFRAPNVDDLGKIFDSSPGNVIVPNADVVPEYTYNGELTLSRNFGGRFDLRATGWYTLYRNALVVRNGEVNGADSIMYDGVLSRVQTMTNAGRAFVAGVDASMRFLIDKHWSMVSTLTWTRGRDVSSDVPLDHIPPAFGKTSFSWNKKKVRTEVYAVYNGWKRIEDFSPNGEDNQQFATVDGIPSWWTLNFRMAWAFTQKFKLQLALANIFNRHYRYFASGISAPGRNFVATLRVSL